MGDRFNVYTDDDFGDLFWHDSTIHKIIFMPETYRLVLDIDYMTGEEGGRNLISPSLLEFYNVEKLRINIDWGDSALEACIDAITRMAERLSPNKKFKMWNWEIAIEWPSPGGSISFTSTGFRMISYKNAISTPEPRLAPKEREQISREFPSLIEA